MGSQICLSTPSLDWEQMVDQLSQDPHADSVTDSALEAVSMGEGRADITGDEEVESRDNGSTTQVTAGAGVTDLDWDPMTRSLSLMMRTWVQPTFPWLL